MSKVERGKKVRGGEFPSKVTKEKLWVITFELRMKCCSKGAYAKDWKKSILGRRGSKWKAEQIGQKGGRGYREVKKAGQGRASVHKVAKQQPVGLKPSWLSLHVEVTHFYSLLVSGLTTSLTCFSFGKKEWHLTHDFGRRKWAYVACPSLSFSFFGLHLLRGRTYSDIFSLIPNQVCRYTTWTVARWLSLSNSGVENQLLFWSPSALTQLFLNQDGGNRWVEKLDFLNIHDNAWACWSHTLTSKYLFFIKIIILWLDL